jgi:hypothetical protein
MMRSESTCSKKVARRAEDTDIEKCVVADVVTGSTEYANEGVVDGVVGDGITG